MILSKKREQVRFIRFAIVGAIGAVIDISIFNLLSSILKIPALTAQAVSFSVAVISNFLWNRYWTYPDSRNKAVFNQLIQFILVSVIGLAVRTLIFDRLEEVLIWSASQILPPNFFLTPNIVGHNISLGIVIIIIMFWNFFVNRFWTYNDVE
jgi:putative flippase GtrA